VKELFVQFLKLYLIGPTAKKSLCWTPNITVQAAYFCQ